MAESQTLPATHRALVQHVYAEPLVVEEVPTPQPAQGAAVLRIEAASVISYQRDVYNGTRKYPYPTPMVTGLWAIGRVVAPGPDAATLQPGQLVFFDSFIRARDDPSVSILSGMSDLGDPGARKLMAGEWRDSTFAQFARVPLENCLQLDEARLCNELGYSVDQLLWTGMALVGYGGLRGIALQAGETVIVAPATGGFGSAAALVAAAMGARVIAMGRNAEKLQQLKTLSPRIHIVAMSGDDEADSRALAAFGRVDAFLDVSPPTTTQLPHVKAAVGALRKGGRISLMGGIGADLTLPFFDIVFKDLTLKGQWMYSPSQARDLVKLMESGALSLDHVRVTGKFALEEWEQAFEAAATMSVAEVTALSAW